MEERGREGELVEAERWGVEGETVIGERKASTTPSIKLPDSVNAVLSSITTHQYFLLDATL